MTTHKLITTACFAVLSSVAFSVTAQMPTNLDARMVERELANINAPVKSNESLNNYLNQQRDTPLDKLSSTSKQEFLDSLMFTKSGLASFRYDVLEKELTPTEVYPILALFGMQHNTAQLNGAQVRTSLDRAVLQFNAHRSKAVAGNDFGAFGSTLGGIASGIPGESDGFGDDYKDMYCLSVGNCAPMSKWICTSNC